MNSEIIKIFTNPEVYAENSRKYLSDDVFEEYYRSLPEYRKKKIDSLKRKKDKRLSLAAEILLENAVKDAGFDYAKYELKFGENGKGYFPELSGIFNFNLSHSGDYAVCAVNHGPEQIGCDVEKIRKVNFNVAKRFFTEKEYETVLSEASEEKRLETFFRIWTLKESYIKALGTGLHKSLRSFEITVSKEGNIFLSGDENGNYVFGTTTTDFGYVISWCLENRQ
jgi:4'-phosphopantetheinyl transferase